MSDVSSVASGTTGAGGGNKIRLTGMASGLDVDAVVKKMMTAEQTKLDKAKQDQQTDQWKQDIYQDVIKNIKDLQSSFLDSGSSDKNILSSTNFAPYTVTAASGASTVDTSIATFKPMVGAQTGKYSVTVNKLAAGAGISNTLSGKALSTSLTDIGGTSLNGTIKLVLNAGSASDVNVTLDNTNGKATLGDLINAINNQGSGSVKATYSELTGQFKLSSSSTGKDTSLTIKTGSTAALSSVFGNGIGNDAFGSAIDGITNADGAIQKNGNNADLTITAPGGNAVPLNDANGNAKTGNNFTIDGMSYALSSVGTAEINVGSDTDKVYDKIKGFIDKYNSIVDDIQTKITEKKSSDYKPLTDTQKASMTTSQITAWETKAKVGILKNDDNLENMLNDLRTAFTTSVSNAGFSLGRYGSNNIGIDTSDDWAKPAHIDIVDPTQLKQVILTKSDQISKMFTNASSVANTVAKDGTVQYDSSLTQYKEDGIFTRVKKILEKNVGYTNTTLNTAVLTSYANKQYDYTTTGTGGKNTLPDKIYEQQLKIKDITTKMSTKQEQYYQKFSKLESLMTTLNAQQSQLSSMLGS